MRRIYLDHAATTPLDPEVLEAMLPYLKDDFGNPSSVHSFGQRSRGAIDEARFKVASLIGSRDAEIVFTGSGTESDNMALMGVLQASERTHLVTSAIEHHAVLNCVKALDPSKHHVTLARVLGTGQVDLNDVERAVHDATALVSVMLANNETGVIQPITEVARIAHAKGALAHTDAVQGLGKVPLDVAALDVDLMTLSAHKINGPKGVGALYVRSGTRMTALVRGGSQERNRRAGTENVAAIVGFGAAAERAQSRIAEDTRRMAHLRDLLETVLIAAGQGRVRGNGAEVARICSTSSLFFDGVSGEDLLIALDMAGIAVSTGAACAAGSPEPSHVLKAMGLSREQVSASLRFSVGRNTTEEDITRTITVVTQAVAGLRASQSRRA